MQCIVHDIDGMLEWFVWLLACAACVGWGVLGIRTSQHAEPLMRLGYVTMIVAGAVSVVTPGWSRDRVGPAQLYCAALCVVLSVAAAIDDAVDRCNTFRSRPWMRVLFLGAVVAALLLFLLYANHGDRDVERHYYVEQGFFLALLAAGFGVSLFYRIETRKQIDLVAGEEAREGEAAVVVRCATLAVAAAGVAVLAGAVGVWTGWYSGDHADAGPRCAAHGAVHTLMLAALLGSCFYQNVSVVVMRVMGGCVKMPVEYSLRKGVLPVCTVADTAPRA
jgi:hypothetical protein